MNIPNPSNRQSPRGARLVRASVVLGLAAAVGLQAADLGDAPLMQAPGALADCGSGTSAL
jgi:hypothetical protein